MKRLYQSIICRRSFFGYVNLLVPCFGSSTAIFISVSGFIWHSQMRDYHKSLKEKGITQSMSRKGNCLDNSITENFFGLMKKRDVLGHQHDFMTLNDLEQAMKEYIEYYNTQRIKVKLKGLTPVRYRKESLRFQTS